MASSINSTSAGNGGLVSTGDDSGILNIQTNETTAITVDASQNVGIGTTTPVGKLSVYGAGALATFQNATTGSTGSDGSYIALGGSDLQISNRESANIILYTVDTERMRIDSSGRVSIGANAVLSSEIIYALANTTDFGSRIYNSNSSSPNGLILKYSGASPNNTGNNMLISQDSTTTRFYFSSNGGLNNYSANNTNLSDQREKKDIEIAPSYLSKICAIPVKTFLYNDQTDTDLNLGVIAQDVQAVAPELVMESNWGTEEEPKMRISVYQTDLQYALMKSIQELKAMVDSIQSEFDAYKATHP